MFCCDAECCKDFSVCLFVFFVSTFVRTNDSHEISNIFRIKKTSRKKKRLQRLSIGGVIGNESPPGNNSREGNRRTKYKCLYMRMYVCMYGCMQCVF